MNIVVMLMLDYTGGIGVSDSVLIQIDNLGVPRVGILNTFAGEYSDSVRFEPYYSEKVGMLAVTGFRAESRPGGEVWLWCCGIRIMNCLIHLG